MDKKAIQRKQQKILKHINESLEMEFEEISFKGNVILLGVRASRSVWIFMKGKELVIQESFFAKGARYKRSEQLEEFELTDELVEESKKKVKKYLTELDIKEKKEKLRNLFVIKKEYTESLMNSNLTSFIEYIIKNEDGERYKYYEADKIYERISKEFQGTKYETPERFIPLLQGLQFHPSYDLGFMSKSGESFTVSVVKTASNKAILKFVGEEKARVYDTEKEMFDHYRRCPEDFQNEQRDKKVLVNSIGKRK